MNSIPSLFDAPDDLQRRFEDFLARRITNPHTKRAYTAAARCFSHWCESRGISEVAQLDAGLVAEFIDDCKDQFSPATVKQRVACLRRLFSWLETFEMTAPDLFRAMRTEYAPQQSRIPVHLTDRAAGGLIASCASASLKDCRDRAVIALLISLFPPVQTVCRLRLRDFTRKGDEAWLRLGRSTDRGLFRVPTELTKLLDDYMRMAGLASKEAGWFFRAIAGVSGVMTDRALSQADLYRIVRSRAVAAGLKTQIGPRELRQYGLTRFLKSGRSLEIARRLSEHKTTKSTIRYAPEGVQRPRNRIACRLPRSEAMLDFYYR